MVSGQVSGLHSIALTSRQLPLTARRREDGGRCKASGRDVRAELNGDARDDQRGADDAEGSLPHDGGAGEPPMRSRARWYSSAVMSPLANLRARMSRGASAIAG